MATGRLMVIEIILNIVALYLCRDYPRHAKLTTFLTSAFVFWKTLLYMTLYIAPPQGSINYLAESAGTWKRIFIFWLPDLVWCLVPLAIIVNLWNDLIDPIDDMKPAYYESVHALIHFYHHAMHATHSLPHSNIPSLHLPVHLFMISFLFFPSMISICRKSKIMHDAYYTDSGILVHAVISLSRIHSAYVVV
uniref:Transmembrane protein n=1 Tax=Elaeophora elaphi TaxID=1147741 RepID=A0A0R3S6A5_9BILA